MLNETFMENFSLSESENESILSINPIGDILSFSIAFDNYLSLVLSFSKADKRKEIKLETMIAI